MMDVMAIPMETSFVKSPHWNFAPSWCARANMYLITLSLISGSKLTPPLRLAAMGFLEGSTTFLFGPIVSALFFFDGPGLGASIDLLPPVISHV